MRRAVVAVGLLLALAGGAQAAPADAPQQEDVGEILSEGAEGAADGVVGATDAAASGAGSAAGSLGASLAAAAGAVMAAASSVAAGLATAASWTASMMGTAVAGLVAGAAPLAAALGAVASAAVDGLAALAAGVVDAAVLVAVGSLDLVLSAVRNLAASPAGRREAAARGMAGGVSGAAAWSSYRAGLRNGMLAPLYSRIGRDELLDHDVRQAIYDYVGENPGAHVSEIAEAVDVGWGTAVYHLERLASAEILVSESSGNHRCFFRNGGVSEEAREAIPALKSDKARDVVAFVRENPAASQKEVAEALDMSAALVSWHVSRLAESGLLEKEREGRGNALYVDDETAGQALKAAAA